MVEYHLIFKGEIYKGIQKAECVQALAEFLHKTPLQIEHKLFAGKAILILKTQDTNKIRDYAQAFKAAGAQLHIKKKEIIPDFDEIPDFDDISDTLATHNQAQDHQVVEIKIDHASEKQPEKNKLKIKINLKPSVPRWLKISLTTSILLGAAGAAAYLWIEDKLNIQPLSSELLQTEAALAQDNILALAHINLNKVVDLENTFLGPEDPKALSQSDQDGLINQLYENGFNPRDDIEQLLLSIHLSGENKQPTYTLAAFGDFNPEKITAYMQSHYEVSWPENNPNILLFKQQDINTCDFSPLQAIHLSSRRILISTPEYLPQLIDDIQGQKTAAINLAPWQQYRNQRLASATLFNPAYTHRAANGIMGMMLSGFKDKFQNVEAIYAGLGPQLYPPGIKMNLALQSQDQAWRNNSAQQIQNLLNDSAARAKSSLPGMVDIYKQIQVENKQHQLNLGLTIDQALLDKFKSLGREFLISFFPQATTTGNNQHVAEQLDKKPNLYRASYDASLIPAFNKIPDINFMPDWQSGPFGLQLDSVKYNEQQQLELTYSAEGRQIKNMGKAQGLIHLVIEDALDSNDLSLLAEESCGENRNTLPGNIDQMQEGIQFIDGKSIHYAKITGSKTIRLRPGNKLKDIKLLKGHIAMQLPSRLNTIQIQAPFKDQVIEQNGVRIQFNASNNDQLQYSISGEKHRVLEVRALNANGEFLSWSGSSSMGRLLGQGTSHSQSFHGTIANAEVIIAEEFQQHKYAFDLKKFWPKQMKAYSQKKVSHKTFNLQSYNQAFSSGQAPNPLQENSWLGESQSTDIRDPWLMELYQFSISRHWGASGTMQITGPLVPSLANNLSALEIQLQQTMTDSEEVETLDYTDYVELMQPGGYYLNGVFQADKNKMYLQASHNLRFPYDSDAPSKLQGTLILRLPSAIESREIMLDQLGNQTAGLGMIISYTGIARGSIDMQIQGERNKLVAIDILDEFDNFIGTQTHISKVEGSELWNGQIRFNGIAHKAVIYQASKQDMVRVPFSFDGL